MDSEPEYQSPLVSESDLLLRVRDWEPVCRVRKWFDRLQRTEWLLHVSTNP